MTRTLDGKTALVTGGTRGIGRAIATRLVADGAAVTVTGTRPGGAAPEGCAYEACDFADRAALLAFAERVRALTPDILVNNAGINVIATFLLCQAALPGMKARGWGRMVNLSSIVGNVGREHRAAYGASKFAIDGLTASMAAEVAADGIIANSVAPGLILTEMSSAMLGEEGRARMSRDISIGRGGQPEEVAALVAFLVRPENTFIVGENILIDGGYVRSRYMR
jgi:NAD(P)-dependent dehydrogenase (short-subunit alcohol dehydrogenase family)